VLLATAAKSLTASKRLRGASTNPSGRRAQIRLLRGRRDIVAIRPQGSSRLDSDLCGAYLTIKPPATLDCARGRDRVRASSFGIALIAAGVAGIILGLVGAHTGDPTVGEQKWYWLVTAISLLPLVVGFLLFRSS
jgi:hypothetical protein